MGKKYRVKTECSYWDFDKFGSRTGWVWPRSSKGIKKIPPRTNSDERIEVISVGKIIDIDDKNLLYTSFGYTVWEVTAPNGKKAFIYQLEPDKINLELEHKSEKSEPDKIPEHKYELHKVPDWISLELIDPDGKPIANEKVTLILDDSKKTKIKCTTDSDGKIFKKKIQSGKVVKLKSDRLELEIKK
jgi:hypothetical protein